MKKFSFNLKFLDLFKKKSKKEETSESTDLQDQAEYSSLEDDSSTTPDFKFPTPPKNNYFADESGEIKEIKEDEEEEFDLEFDENELAVENETEETEVVSLDSEDDFESSQENQEDVIPNIPSDVIENSTVAFSQSSDNTDPEMTFPIPPSTENEFTDDSQIDEHAENTLTNFDLEKFRKEHAHLENDYSEADITNPNFEFKELNLNNLEQKNSSKKTRFSFKMPKFGGTSSGEKTTIKFKTPSFKNVDFKNILKYKSNSKDFSFNDTFTYLFSTELRPKIHNVFIICLLIFVTYFTGKSAALLLSGNTSTNAKARSNSIPEIRPTNSTQDLNKISSVNLFNIKNSENDLQQTQTQKPKNLICIDSEKPTAEPLKLLDTIVLQDSVKSIASVQMRGQNDLLNVREGEEINSGIEVAKITRLKVILKNLNTGECEYISNFDADQLASSNLKISPPSMAKNIFKGTNPNIKNEGNNFKINTKFRDEMIGNMSEILTQAKAIQLKNPDGSLSFKMTEVVPGSIYSQLNIQNDDVITSINGKKIENLNELMSLLGKIKEIDHFQIGLRRNGVSENLEYNFE